MSQPTAPHQEDATLHSLRERVKELTALHRTARVLQSHELSDREPVADIVALLPPAWQYPEVAAARIRIGDEEHQTEEFRETVWSQEAGFVTRDGEAGSVTVVYLEERPPADEGPFLREERELIDSLAEMLRSYLDRRIAERAMREARHALQTQVFARTVDLRRLASKLILAEEKERRRIASGLHDQIGQALAIIKIRIREFQGNAVFGGFEEEIAEILGLLDQTIRYTRTLTGEISPPVLYELGLEPALDWLAEHYTDRHHFRVRFLSHGEAAPLPEELAIMLFTSARELLLNCLKYSGEKGASMELIWGTEDLRLSVEDRGRGMDSTRHAVPVGDGFGLFSIRERIGDLGGTVETVSSPGAGCRVTLAVPRSEGGAV